MVVRVAGGRLCVGFLPAGRRIFPHGGRDRHAGEGLCPSRRDGGQHQQGDEQRPAGAEKASSDAQTTPLTEWCGPPAAMAA